MNQAKEKKTVEEGRRSGCRRIADGLQSWEDTSRVMETIRPPAREGSATPRSGPVVDFAAEPSDVVLAEEDAPDTIPAPPPELD